MGIGQQPQHANTNEMISLQAISITLYSTAQAVGKGVPCTDRPWHATRTYIANNKSHPILTEPNETDSSSTTAYMHHAVLYIREDSLALYWPWQCIIVEYFPFRLHCPILGRFEGSPRIIVYQCTIFIK